MKATSFNERAASRWIQNPALDLIVGCGAWSVPLLLLSYSRLANSPAWSIGFYGLALFLNYPHYMSTLYRAYHNEADFQKYRIFTVHITGLVLLTAVISHFRFSLLPWIFTLYLTTSPWHYTGQNYGIFMMFARRAGAQITENTRQAIYSAFILSYAILFLSLHTGPSDRLFYSLGIPEARALVARIILAIAFVAFSAYGLYGLIRQIGWKQSLPALVLFSTQILWFLVPGLLMLVKGFSVPQSRYSTGVLAVMHSAQYLWITSYYARRESAADGTRWRPFAYFAVLIVGGIALFMPGPWLASYVFHYDFTASFLIFTALVNLHHFILDGAIWKLRDGRIAALLLNTQERVAGAAETASGGAGRAWQWVRSRATVPRTLRIATALILLALAGVDQARYVLASHADDLDAMRQAAALNPFDTSLELRIARKQAEAGDSDAAIHAYEEAIAANPADLAPRNAFLKYLVANRRFGEADAVAKAALARWPNDPDLLVNRGILAAGLGQQTEALASWEKALSVDPGQIYAHLYLADELDRQQKPEAAIPHYTLFLDQLAKSGNKPDPDVVLPALMNLAQCNLRVGHPERALKLYDLGRTLAAQTHQPTIESAASLNEAILISKSDHIGDALHLYQNALKLDRAANDPAAEAADWRAYAAFLNSRGFDKKFSYAATVRAEILTQNLNGKTQADQQPVRVQLETTLGNSAAAIRKNPMPLLEQALQLESK
jgi:tetratricopeptide (TPR) repeat protein